MFFETTIMEKTADLAMIQKTNTDTLHKEGKSQRVITEGVAVYRVLYQSILNARLTGRKNLDRKRCTSNRDDCKLENTVKQSWFKHLGELHKEWTEAGVSASRVTTLRRLQEKGYQATSEPETTSEASYLAVEKKNWTVAQWSKVLFSDESKFWISFGKSRSRVWRKSGEAQNPCCLKSSVKFPQSVMIWAAMSSAGVGPLCFSEVHSQRSHLPGNFRALPCFLLLTSFMEMLISFYSRTWHLPTLPKVPKAGSMTMVLLGLIGQQTRLTWTP